MNRKTIFILLLITTLAGCGGEGSDSPNAPNVGEIGPKTFDYQKYQAVEAPEADKKAVAGANNAFAVDLYDQLRSREGNLFFSPYSISTALAMTHAGARGATAEQMKKVLHFGLQISATRRLDGEQLHQACGALIHNLTTSDDAGYTLNIANALWGQQDYQFLQSYLDLTGKYYGAGFKPVDFGKTEAARQTINRWVEINTEDKIKDLFKPGVLTPQTRLVLTNAVYFLGDWQNPFKAENTRQQTFTLLSGEQKNVPMMRQTEHFRYTELPTCQVIRLPYKNSKLSMLIFLPKEKDGLGEVETKVLGKGPMRGTFLPLHFPAAMLEQMKSTNVALALPKFEMTSQFSLADTLAKLGMPDAFDSNKADFSGITGNRDLFVSAVVHKAYVKIDEKGTEAAAATGVVATLESIPMEPKQFIANHPFLFAIIDEQSGAVLFLGRVTDI